MLLPVGSIWGCILSGGSPQAAGVCAAIALSIMVVEITRWGVDYSHEVFGLPAFPVPRQAVAEAHWQSKRDDEAITAADHDLVGRTAVLEALARSALQFRIPVIALKGAYGDGKTSVLNLLERQLKKDALVIYFKSWLPGSEVSLAAALLRDISLTVNQHLYVPGLRRRTLAFLRIVAGSHSHLGGLKDLIPAYTQADEFRRLARTLKRIPRPIVVLLDELDRMEQAEVLVLFKLLRG